MADLKLAFLTNGQIDALLNIHLTSENVRTFHQYNFSVPINWHFNILPSILVHIIAFVRTDKELN
jgi:p-aminobenzoyl-glutamate transporter AbgT